MTAAASGVLLRRTPPGPAAQQQPRAAASAGMLWRGVSGAEPRRWGRREWLQRLLVGMAAPWLTECQSSAKPVSRPPAGPSLIRPIQAVPADLQLVVRVNAQRLLEAAGRQSVDNVKQRSQLAPLSEPLLLWALERSDTVWAALRLGLSAEKTDNVVVVTGDFAEFKPERQRWSPPDDLGGGWQRWDRRDKVLRALPARIYALAGELLVFVSEAEIDPVERTLERGLAADLVEPPERGLVSLAASMPALTQAIADEAPRAATLLAKGKTVTGYADLEYDKGLAVALDFDFGDARQAARSALAAELFVQSLSASAGALASLASQVRIEAVHESVLVRLELSAALLSGWLPAS